MSQLAFTFRYSAPILLILMTITAIFLFIYFLDYVTSTNKFGTVIQSVVNQKFVTMKNQLAEIEEVHVPWENLPFVEIKTQQSNYIKVLTKKNYWRLLSPYLYSSPFYIQKKLF
jgi:uncharacterized membrane protein